MNVIESYWLHNHDSINLPAFLPDTSRAVSRDVRLCVKTFWLPPEQIDEIDPVSAAWLRTLMAAGWVAPGVVDERSIEDISPHELARYTQCHFFAGIGVWSYALRLAGWKDEWPVWTGSCPCQSFSAAGTGKGFADERHLWPAWFHLIDQCRPHVVFGEQVEAAVRKGWLDLVQADLEGVGYGLGVASTPACGFGAPHMRQRLYFGAASERGLRGLHRIGVTLGNTIRPQLERLSGHGSDRQGRQEGEARSTAETSITHGVAHAGGESSQRDARGISREKTGSSGSRVEAGNLPQRHQHGGEAHGMGDTGSERRQSVQDELRGIRAGVESSRSKPIQSSQAVSDSRGLADNAVHGHAASYGLRETAEPSVTSGEKSKWQFTRGGDSNNVEQPGPTNGVWRDVDWLRCRDERWRPTEPGTLPLANGVAGRVGRLRGYGNAIVAEQAKAYIKSFMYAAYKTVGERE